MRLTRDPVSPAPSKGSAQVGEGRRSAAGGKGLVCLRGDGGMPTRENVQEHHTMHCVSPVSLGPQLVGELRVYRLYLNPKASKP